MSVDKKGLSVSDRVDISDALARCARAHDTRNTKVYADVFAADATLDLGEHGVVNGISDITEFFDGSLVGYDYVQHRLSTSVIVCSKDGAFAETYFSSRHVRRAAVGGDTLVLGGTYFDEFVKNDDGWRIRKRVVKVEWSDGNSSVAEL